MQLDDNQTSIELDWKGRKYYLVCEKESLLGELHDVVCVFRNHVIQTMLQSMKPADPQPTPAPEAK